MNQIPNFSDLIDSYRSLFKEFGYSPKSLGWKNGKQFLRFHQLTSLWDLENSTWLDVGCGFGDFIKFLRSSEIDNFNYMGIDIVSEFVNLAKIHYPNPNCNFINEPFLESNFIKTYDYVIASGTFNSQIDGINGYEYIENNIVKMYNLCNKAIAIDFITDKVNFKHEHNFNSNPERILSLAYDLSKRVVLRNDYFPFEFAVIIFKEDSFNPELTLYSEIYRNLNHLL